MLKSIKKSYIFLIVVAAVVILLPSVLFLIVRNPVVQTFMVKKIAGYISKEIKSTVSVGDVEFILFNKLSVNDLLIKDQNNDTLLFTSNITAGIKQFDIRKNIVRLGKVVVIEPVVSFITDSTGLMNLTWYLNMFRKPGDSTDIKSPVFLINEIDISDGLFSLRKQIRSKSKIPIDFNDLNLAGVNAIIENVKVGNDFISFDIFDLGFKESNGFTVKKMNSGFLLKKQNILFNDITLICDSSILNADHISIMADSVSLFKNFTEEVIFDISLKKSLINSSDLKYFLPYVRYFNESVYLSGDVTGTVSELKGRNVYISYKDETFVDCNFDFSGLPDVENTFMFIDVNDLRSNYKDIENMNVPGKGYDILPDIFQKLGIISFSGSFTGFITDFVTYGRIKTNNGLLSTDISLRPDESHRFRIKGLLKGSEIDLGVLTGNTGLFGNLSVEANVDGYTTSFKTFSANITGEIDSVEINNYKYRDIALNGNFTDKAWDGNIKVEDENIRMDFLGRFDFSTELPEFDFTLNLMKANLQKLNIFKTDTASSLTMLLTANFKGNSIDNLDGEIKVLNSNLRKYVNELEINDFTIKAFTENNIPSLTLRTDFIDGDLYGRYNFAGLGAVIKKSLALLMPAKFTKPEEKEILSENNFVFDLKFKNTNDLNKVFKTGILLADTSIITGSFFPDSIISVTGKTKMFAFKNNIFNDLSFNAQVKDTVLGISLKSTSCDLSGLADLNDLNINVDTRPDYLRFFLNWDNKDRILNKGTFIAEGTLKKNPDRNGSPSLNIDLRPGEIFIRNNLWKINSTPIIVDSNSVKIGKLYINNGENFFLVDGAVSENPTDTLHLEFNGINIAPINNLYEKKVAADPNRIHLALGGNLNGKILFTDFYKNFMFESDIRIEDFSLLESKYGEIKIESAWNSSGKIAEIFANNNLNGASMFNVNGYYNPQVKQVDLVARTDKLPIDILNPLLKTFASGINGTASGTVRLSGEFRKPVLTGALMGRNATIKINFLQTKYTFSDSIRFDRAGIKFDNIQMFDEKGNTATLNGAVYHKYFKDYAVDLTIRTNDCMVLNTKPKDNELFYGTAYASGVTTIKTTGPVLSFDISAKTGKNTKFIIPLNTGLSVSENAFVSFIDTNNGEKKEDIGVNQPSAPAASKALEIAFDLEVTPDAEVELIMDPKVGDIITGIGTGNLNISLDRKGAFKIYGDYTIDGGDYLFTLGNVIGKRFIVEKGGKISFNGDMEEAEINLKANYQKIKTSLYEIAQDENYKDESIYAQPYLLLTGKLFNPVVTYDTDLPDADNKTKAYFNSMIKSEEDRSRQFLFLLVMQRFYADPVPGTQQSIAAMSTETIGKSASEMLFNQLSNWLSDINEDFDIGIVYRPGSTTMPNSQELEVALSTQLLNDRVTINGNFDVRGTGNTTDNQFSGDFDTEVKITDKIRFKVFNRYNPPYTGKQVNYTQGLGLSYRQDFNKLKDLFEKSEKGEMKKEEKTKIRKQ